MVFVECIIALWQMQHDCVDYHSPRQYDEIYQTYTTNGCSMCH